jgi:ceramide glucosyltransferase
VVQRLIAEFPGADARLIVCGALTGANAKVSKLVELMGHAKHELVAVSDADVKVPRDFLANVVLPFQEEKSNVGLVNCFYRLAGLSTLAMQWEAVAINADFWSQVLQAESLRPIDFALGAVMVLRRKDLEGIGGFEALKDCLADDYQLGHRIAGKGKRIALCPLVVECWSEPMFFPAVWKHQLRWARTIRVCQPVPYFFSILSNPTFWPLVWLGVNRGAGGLGTLVLCLVVRIWTSLDLQKLLAGTWVPLRYGWLAPMKDLLHTLIWAQSFAGNSIEWRGERMRLRRDGTLERAGMARG